MVPANSRLAASRPKQCSATNDGSSDKMRSANGPPDDGYTMLQKTKPAAPRILPHSADFEFDLDQLIRNRRSIRSFLPRPVPRALLDEALTIAQRAPSSSNVQPWRLVLAAGACRDRLSRALRAAAERGPMSNILPPLPEVFQHRRQALGELVYEAMGIARDDHAARRQALLRNYDFFGAPTVGIVCMPEALGVADAVSVGMYLQTLVLSLSVRGLGTCAQVALAGYPEIIRGVLNIPSDLLIICGLAIGYADPAFPANHLHIPRVPVTETVTFLED
jgi:nitroreductase